MKKQWIYAFLGSAFIGFAAYLSSGLWYVGLMVGLLSFVLALYYVIPCVIRFSEKSRKRHECYLFIHGYLVTLSVCMSLDKAFEAGAASLGKEFHSLDQTLATMNPREKTEYLVSYFESDLYRLFLSILHLYMERGGDVLKLSAELTAEASRLEETEQAYEKSALRKGFTFFFLWAMALVIVVFIRFGLSSFFASLHTSLTYILANAFFYAFFLFSAVLYLYFHTGVPLVKFRKRRARHEKA